MENKDFDKIKESFEDEESELEEEVEEAEETIENKEFHEFIQQPSVKSFTTILEKIETPIESLEQDIISTPVAQEEKNEEPIKYSPKYGEADYQAIEEESRRINENLLVRPSTINMETTKIDFRPRVEQDFQISPELQELRRGKNLEEDYVAQAKRLDEEHRLPFEQTQIKYKGKPI
jgi:hypothetical protein